MTRRPEPGPPDLLTPGELGTLFRAAATAADAHERFEAVIRQRFSRYTRHPEVDEDVAVIAEAALEYLHAVGLAGITAKRYARQAGDLEQVIRLLARLFEDEGKQAA